MGQRISVAADVVGEVALLHGDRSLTGQAGESFSSPVHAEAAAGLPAALAASLLTLDAAIDHVHVASNEVAVRRRGGWTSSALDEAKRAVEGFFVFYGDGTDLPIGGVGRGLAVKPAPAARPRLSADEIGALRADHYNATITYIRPAHANLWVMGIVPDGGVPDYAAGQYATLGLGYWEPRIDELEEEMTEDAVRKLARRSYSISSPILGAGGALATHEDALEFYVVLVEQDWQGTPAVLTPRLFLKQEDDRIYMGNKIAGRYRLDRCDDRDADVIFLSTGTGEAPHNRMIVDLLASGHRGKIVSACTVRYRRDLAYLDVHRQLEGRYPNYRYVPLTTREPENEGNKVYLQDLIESGMLERELGADLDPGRMHFFLCGNPEMIGLPEWDGDTPLFPERRGVAEILTERGFTLDRGRTTGTIHYEEYW